MQTGLKRAEQAQPSSPARSCRCYSREWEEEVARSAQSFRRHLRGPGSKEGMGEGLAAEGPLRAAAALGLPAPGTRPSHCPAAPPARPRRSDHGLFLWGAGLESGPGRLRRRSGNSAHGLPAIGGHGPQRYPRTGPPGAPRKDPGRHSPPQGPRRGLHRLQPPAGRAPAPSPCLRRPRAGPARPPGNATGRGACAPGAGPAEGRPPDSGLRNARRPLPAPGAFSGKTSGCALPGVPQRHL